MNNVSRTFPIVRIQSSVSQSDLEIENQIMRTVQDGISDDSIIHLEVSKDRLKNDWENVIVEGGPLALRYPLHVYSGGSSPPPKIDSPLRVLFTTPASAPKIETEILKKIQKDYGADAILEFNCSRDRLINSLRERPVHIWHHKNAEFRNGQILINLCDGPISIQQLMNKHVSASVILLQSPNALETAAEIPRLVVLSTKIDSEASRVLLSGFYDRVVGHPLEVAIFLARLDQYVKEPSNDTWKRLKLRGTSPDTDLQATIRSPAHQTKLSQALVLFLKANPLNTKRLGVDQEFRNVRDISARVGNHFLQFKLESAVRKWDIHWLLDVYQPSIIHFSGHGNKNGFLQFEGDIEGLSSAPISGKALSAILKHHAPPLRCVVLNACWSERTARQLTEHIDCAVGMRHGISDFAAMHFSMQFYGALASGKSIGESFERARDFLMSASNESGIADERLTPRLLHQEGKDPFTLHFHDPHAPLHTSIH